MLVGIDYDDTYTTDPAMWDAVIAVLEESCHEVIMVTSRRRTFANTYDLNSHDHGIPIVFCSYNAKAEFMDKLGQHVDIWIDDDPATINPDGKPKEKYRKWKESGI